MSFLVGGRTDFQFAETTEVAANMDVETGEDKLGGPNQSGIEELLRASNMAGPGAMEDLECVAHHFFIFSERFT